MIYAWPAIPEELFPQAEAYRRYRCRDCVYETPARYFPGSERHLHALWFDDSLRPEKLKTVRGEPVTVESPGRWNLEAGPDFRDAVLLVGREGRRVAGDVEIHISPADWKHHGHARDPRYNNVRFHICWFPGAADDSLFPPGTLHLALGDACETDLESIDLAAYPYKEPRANSRFPLAGKEPDEIVKLLESAGEERLRRKTLRMASLVRRCGAAQALYEETAAALGYKHNKAPFRKLAQRLPLAAAGQYKADWKTLYAVLLGLAGLLPGQPGIGWPAASKKELRALWDLWWREAHRWEDVGPLEKKEWRLAGARPLNHPIRRLCALAQWTAAGIFQHPKENGALSADAFPKPEPCFWTEHTGWTGKEKRAELVGPGRMKAIELNVLVPFRLVQGDANALRRLPAEPVNSIIRETAYTLFGPDHSPTLYRSALARQGLLQLFNDTILTGELAGLEQSENVCLTV